VEPRRFLDTAPALCNKAEIISARVRWSDSMAMNIETMLYLQEKGLLNSDKNRLLDIGPQNVYFCTEEQIRKLVRQQGTKVSAEKFDQDAKGLAYFSTPRPEENTTLFSEIADLAQIDYHAFDICPAPKTDIFDLNFDSLSQEHREQYDVVLNFGTTERVFNQWNSFTVIHDATKVGGVIYCILPITGYLDHGYYCYTPLFFKQMSEANEYQILDLFIAPGAGINGIKNNGLDVRAEGSFLTPNSANLSSGTDMIPSYNIHAVMRKTRRGRFRCGMEVATAHSRVDPEIAAFYSTDERAIVQLRAELDRGQRELDEARDQLQQVVTSRSWRLTAPLRKLVTMMRGEAAAD
jgi:hypothetical protein